MSILEIQKALKAAGYDPGPLDGKDGPRTHAALLAFQQAKGLSTAADKWGDTQAALGGGSGSAGSVGAQADAATAAKYPQFAFLWNDPEIGPLLRQGLPAVQLAAQVQNTQWYRSRTEAERNYLTEAALDPKETTRRLNNYDSINKYMQMAAQYGQTVTFQNAADQFDRVVRGEIAPDALEQELRIQAKALYPFLSQIIDSGGNVADVFSKVQNAASQYLGVNPAEVRWDDPKWRSLLSTTDPNGTQRLRSDYEIAQTIRTDPNYGFASTQGGRDTGFGLINAINKGFGMDQVS